MLAFNSYLFISTDIILYSRYFVRFCIYELKLDNIPVWGDSVYGENRQVNLLLLCDLTEKEYIMYFFFYVVYFYDVHQKADRVES